MKWQIKYVLNNFTKHKQFTVKHLGGELIHVSKLDQPDVVAAISDANEISAEIAASYIKNTPKPDFVCGYRPACVWHGGAIGKLERERVGWGNFKTLREAADDGKANTASHEIFKVPDRFLRRSRSVRKITREYDRIYNFNTTNGTHLRLGMILDYDLTANAVRTFWEVFGPVDIIWGINPNAKITPEAIGAALDVGCEVMGWEEFKEHLNTA